KNAVSEAEYFKNHARHDRFPWMLYHREIELRVARALRPVATSARVLIVGCGLSPSVRGIDATFYGSDIDARAIEACKTQHPELAARLDVCPSEYQQPDFGTSFDAIVAKEVVEHVADPSRFARALAARLAPRGKLVLTTPNYGRFSSL